MTPQTLLIAFLLVFVTVQTLFAAFPGIDLAVSALFADGSRGFPWTMGIAPDINLAVRRLGEVATLLLLLGILYGLTSGKTPRDHVRLLAYPFLCVALASGVVVNVLLKSHVGRARPVTLADFGGTAQFTPPWQVVEECARNCSFVSGEVALAAGLAIPTIVILWPHLTRTHSRVLAVGLAAAYILLTATLRVGLGRHFLSDVVFSTLFSAAAALALYTVLGIARARLSLPGRASRRPAIELVEQRGVY
ncbi:phosphatase PAP2 family protein [Rhodobacter calidifons]|uniref:Phosphatase PAP2 family protein n=1 Tax=Rhodobacter calidifons TaxID=2715277 RepID=A0ABX0G7Y1_9RHOB|nr:phosphatase PAP2 family protein [Rhodobacter calidifons]NHB77393.1 phosphatase PAP2 family protein [Rhodobacter calidifons]